MSNSEQDQNQVDVIEAEIIETPKDDNIEPVVVKKGSFLTIVAFILSASALTVSAYLYMLQSNKTSDDDNLAWQVPLADLEKMTAQKFSQLSKQIDQLKKTNGLLQNQLKTIEEIAAKIQPKTNNVPTESTAYDDTQIVQHIKSLETQLAIQDKSLKQTQLNVSNSNTQQKQSLQQLKQQMSQNILSSTASSVTQVNYDDEMIESLLQAAHIQLNVHGNPVKAQELLNKAQNHLKQSTKPQYNNLAVELKTTIDVIMSNSTADITELNKTIDELSRASSLLTFNQNINTQDQKDESQSSWYDKLIVIRKVDDSKQSRQTQDQQQDILQNLKNHYEMMKISIMGNNQKLWDNEITAIEGLLILHFNDDSAVIQSQLKELKAIDVNPSFPDLASYIDKFKGFNNDDFTEHETTSEIVSDPDESNENN